MTLATSFANLGEARIAADQAERARAIYSKHLGPDHPDTLSSMHNLANGYDALGRHADALKLREETLALMKAKLGPDHPKTLAAMNNLADSYAALGATGQGPQAQRRDAGATESQARPRPSSHASEHEQPGRRLQPLGRHAEALKLGEETVDAREIQARPHESPARLAAWTAWPSSTTTLAGSPRPSSSMRRRCRS